MTSGYTYCACRDCMETAISADIFNLVLCQDCEDSGCTEGRSESDAYDCQRGDAS